MARRDDERLFLFGSVDESLLPGECCGLGAIGEVEFGEDFADVGLDGAFGDDEALGDDGVA
jgi:hypothetical protein